MKAAMLIGTRLLNTETNVSPNARWRVGKSIGVLVASDLGVWRLQRPLTHPDGLALSTRRVTLSTSGLVPQIDQLLATSIETRQRAWKRVAGADQLLQVGQAG